MMETSSCHCRLLQQRNLNKPCSRLTQMNGYLNKLFTAVTDQPIITLSLTTLEVQEKAVNSCYGKAKCEISPHCTAKGIAMSNVTIRGGRNCCHTPNSLATQVALHVTHTTKHGLEGQGSLSSILPNADGVTHILSSPFQTRVTLLTPSFYSLKTS